MADIQAILRQQLIDETARLVARGGPGALTPAGPVPLDVAPTAWCLWSPPQADETFYPLDAVLAALPCPDLRTLQHEWYGNNEQLPLPLYLHKAPDGRVTPMVHESFVLGWLIYMTEMCHAEQLREPTR